MYFSLSLALHGSNDDDNGVDDGNAGDDGSK